MSFKAVLLIIVIMIVVVGATGGDQAAASIGNAVGQAIHLVRVAWDAGVRGTK